LFQVLWLRAHYWQLERVLGLAYHTQKGHQLIVIYPETERDVPTTSANDQIVSGAGIL